MFYVLSVYVPTKHQSGDKKSHYYQKTKQKTSYSKCIIWFSKPHWSVILLSIYYFRLTQVKQNLYFIEFCSRSLETRSQSITTLGFGF